MLVERSTLHQSAVGSLFSLLGKSDNPDAPSFEQHFAETVNAITPREQTPRRQGQESIEQDVTSSRPRTEARREDDAPTREIDAGATETPDVAPVETAPRAERERPSDRVQEKETRTEPVSQKTSADTSSDGQETGSSQQEPVVSAPRRMQAKVAMLKELVSSGQALAGTLVTQPVVAEAELVQGVKIEAKAAGQAKALAADPLPVGEVAAVEDAEIQAAAPEASAAVAQDSTRQQSHKTLTQSFKQVSRSASSDASEAAVTKTPAVEQAKSEAVSPQQQKSAPSSNVSQARASVPQTPTLSADVVSVQVVSTSAGEATTASGGNGAVETPAVGKIAGDTSQNRLASVKATAETSQTQSSDAEEQVERIVRVMRASISRGGSRVNMRLDPPELGQLRIQMQIRNGEMVARFETQTDSARNWVHSQLGSLREALAGQNIRLVQASVENRGPGSEQTGGQAGGTGGFTGGHEAGSQQPQQHNAHGQDSAPESEILWWTEPAAQDNEVNVVV
ncbi:MAG: flagellar hook-length control protein FliK [Planctomycetes bacterium]|nr:flagellar hook-length control protein FliK [Planctomycetota bacterium]